MIYLDHNATTPVDQRVLEAMVPYLTSHYANPSALYRAARVARSAIETAREQVAALIDAHPEQIVFTSGGTEANALAIANAQPNRAIAVSAIEHPSVTENARRNLAGCSKTLFIPVDRSGVVPLSALQALQAENPGFVSVMAANNETGALQNISAIAALFDPKQVTVHTDAVQAAGKIPLSFRKLGVGMLSLSSHKLYGPKGCGALVIGNDTAIKALQRGGDQERGLRAGTENVPAIVGFGKAAELAKTELTGHSEKQLSLRKRLENRLLTLPGATIFAGDAERLPNTLQFAIAGMDGTMLLMQLDKHGIAVSSGSACATGDETVSPVLAAMSVATDLAKGAVRISFGRNNTNQDVDRLIDVLTSLLHTSL